MAVHSHIEADLPVSCSADARAMADAMPRKCGVDTRKIGQGNAVAMRWRVDIKFMPG